MSAGGQGILKGRARLENAQGGAGTASYSLEAIEAITASAINGKRPA